jgi:hypothetical protein
MLYISSGWQAIRHFLDLRQLGGLGHRHRARTRCAQRRCAETPNSEGNLADTIVRNEEEFIGNSSTPT